RVDAAGEDARLGRRAEAGRTDDTACVDSTPHRRQQTATGFVASGDADDADAAAEGGDVVGRVAGAAGDEFGRVVVEDQDGRFARDAGDLAVDELVDDKVAEDGDADAAEAV